MIEASWRYKIAWLNMMGELCKQFKWDRGALYFFGRWGEESVALEQWLRTLAE